MRSLFVSGMKWRRLQHRELAHPLSGHRSPLLPLVRTAPVPSAGRMIEAFHGTHAPSGPMMRLHVAADLSNRIERAGLQF